MLVAWSCSPKHVWPFGPGTSACASRSVPGLCPSSLLCLISGLQVTIEVVDDPQAEMEMDLLKETSNDWSLTSSEWLSHKDLFWPLFWEYTDPTEEEEEEEEEDEEDDNLDVGDREEEEEEEDEDYTAEYEEEESMLSGVGGDWDQQWPGQKNWIFKEKYNYGESSWAYGAALQTDTALHCPACPAALSHVREAALCWESQHTGAQYLLRK